MPSDGFKRPRPVVCSAGSQRPGRRTSMCPNDGPRVREGHGRRRLPRGFAGEQPLCLPRTSEPEEVSRSYAGRLEPVRLRVRRGALRGKLRLRGGGFSQLKFSVRQVVLWPIRKTVVGGATDWCL
jgi:hypothetical protein